MAGPLTAGVHAASVMVDCKQTLSTIFVFHLFLQLSKKQGMPIPWKKFKAYIDLYLVLRRALLCSAICLELKKWGFPSIPKSTDPSHFSVTLLLMAFPGGRGRGVSHCVIKIHKPGGVALIFKSRQPSQCPVITQKPSIVLESLNLLRDVPLRDQAWS